ncbi:MAG: hypothetical protein J6S78_01245, partial [Lachnospiraceae bacterium]|nr:hypothetical protein [Lachnospiraceae bacterium]
MYATGNHSWGGWTTIKSATCTEYGSKKHSCNTCGKTESANISPTGHSVNGQVKRVEPTCSSAGYSVSKCSTCGAEVGNRTTLPATGNHNWGGWVTDKAATCTANGSKHHTCSVCGKTESATITAPGHNMNGQIKKVAAT